MQTCSSNEITPLKGYKCVERKAPTLKKKEECNAERERAKSCLEHLTSGAARAWCRMRRWCGGGGAASAEVCVCTCFVVGSLRPVRASIQSQLLNRFQELRTFHSALARWRVLQLSNGQRHFTKKKKNNQNIKEKQIIPEAIPKRKQQ